MYQTSSEPTPRVAGPAGGAVTGSGVFVGVVLTGALIALGLAARPGILFGLVVVAAIFIPIERLFALHIQRVFRKGWSTDVVHFVVNNVFSTVGLFAVVAIFTIALKRAVPAGLGKAVGSQPGLAQFAEAMVVTELAGYFAHLATHRIPVLWRFHKVHHSITEMDWLASARLHPIDQVFTRSCIVLPLFALGFSRATFGAYLAFAALWALFIHANVRFNFGQLRWVISTPQFHHWHHTNDPWATNRNFAAQLPVVDLIFGTAHLPKGEWPSTYGIGEPAPDTYVSQMTWPFRR